MLFPVSYAETLDPQSLFIICNKGCPHCQRTGFLVGHGYLRGYSCSGQPDSVRGKRILCSNRHRKRGCGRTFSIFLVNRIHRHLLSTALLWHFFTLLLQGWILTTAWARSRERFKAQFCQSQGYKITHKIKHRQQRLRTILYRLCPPPPERRTDGEILAVLRHLQHAFPGCADPPAAFQLLFQRGFLDPF